jgi:hypothetical protein
LDARQQYGGLSYHRFFLIPAYPSDQCANVMPQTMVSHHLVVSIVISGHDRDQQLPGRQQKELLREQTTRDFSNRVKTICDLWSGHDSERVKPSMYRWVSSVQVGNGGKDLVIECCDIFS